MSAPDPAYEMNEYERVHRAGIERTRHENQIAAEIDRIRDDPGPPFEEANLLLAGANSSAPTWPIITVSAPSTRAPASRCGTWTKRSTSSPPRPAE